MGHWVLGGTLISLFLALCFRDLSFPGLHYDELYFVDAIRENKFKCCVSYSWNGFPLFLVSYLGALKAWVYWVVDYFVGLNLLSIRGPMILSTGLALFFLLLFFYRIKQTSVGLLFLLFLVLNPTFVLMTKQDIGEVSLFFLLLVLSCLFFSISLQKKSYFILIFHLVLILGVFHRLNFIWFSFPLFFAGWLVFANARKCLFLGFLFHAAVVAALFWRSEISPLEEFARAQGIGARLRSIFWVWSSFLSGGAYSDFLFLKGGIYRSNGLALVPSLFLFFPGLYFLRKSQNLWLKFFFYLFCGALVAYLSSQRAWRHWHLFPAWFFFLGTISFLLMEVLKTRLKLLRFFALVVFTVLLGSYFGEWGLYLHWRKNFAPRALFSQAVYQLTEVCRSMKNTCVDMETNVLTQVAAFLPPDRTVERIPVFHNRSPDRFGPLMDLWFSRKGVEYIVLDEAWRDRPNMTDYFFDYVQEKGHLLEETNRIKDPSGNIVYRLYRLRRL